LIESLEDRRLMSFSTAVNYPAGTSPQDVVRGDFNGDTRLDLAVTNYSTNTVSVLLGNGNGTFQSALTSATGAGPQSVAVGDFNGDGKLDLATSNSADLGVLLGNGNGTFQASTSLGLGATPTGVAVGDFNADGKLDLAAASNVYYPGWSSGYYGYPGYYSGRFNLLLGTGTGSFGAATATPVNNNNWVNSVAAADFNGDGKLDLATADNGYWWGGAHPVVAFGNGAGGLGVTHLASSSGGSPQSVSAGDVNGDGKADLISVNPNLNAVDVLLANGTGGFAAAQSYATGASPMSVELGDFNGDAKIDLISANNWGGSVSVLLGAGTGVFRPPALFGAEGTQPLSVAVGDFNGDGRADAASANNGSANVSVLLNDGNWPSINAPFITINDVTVTEGNSGTVNATLTVSLSAPSAQTVTVKYATTNGSATAANDYNAVTPTLLTFMPNEVSKQITVQVKGDRVAESTESFGVVLSEATNAFLSETIGYVSITDDEPRITIDDVTAAEGNSGTKTFTFTLHLSAASDAAVSVNYSTFEGDTDYWPHNPYSYYYGPPAATAGSDFVAKTGTATFAIGQTSTTVSVVVNGDRVAEYDEAFSLNLSGPSGALIDDAHAVGTITNDEPYVNVSGGSVTEGNSGTQLVPFTITLSEASDVAVTVTYATADGSATTAGGDYVTKTGSVTFAAGETSKTVNVTANGDRSAEGDEYLYLLLGTVTNAGVGSSQAVGYIVDNEPTININSVSVTEGNSGSKLMTFTVTLSAAYDQTVTVGYATQNGSAKTGKDYTAKSGTLTFLAGQTTKTFTVSIKGDKQRESDEWFNVVLRSPSVNALIGNGFGQGTILNDDFR
jgi:hypothetical protein